MAVLNIAIPALAVQVFHAKFEMDEDEGYLELDELGNPIGADIVESDNDVGTCIKDVSA